MGDRLEIVQRAIRHAGGAGALARQLHRDASQISACVRGRARVPDSLVRGCLAVLAGASRVCAIDHSQGRTREDVREDLEWAVAHLESDWRSRRGRARRTIVRESQLAFAPRSLAAMVCGDDSEETWRRLRQGDELSADEELRLLKIGRRVLATICEPIRDDVELDVWTRGSDAREGMHA